MSLRNDPGAESTKQWTHLAIAFAGVLALIILVAIAENLYWISDLETAGLAAADKVSVAMRTIRAVLVAQAKIMALPLEAGSQAFWYLSRASGIVAFLLLWLATCWGIMMSSKIAKGYVKVPVAYALHQYLPILGVVFVALHFVVLLGDAYINFDIWQLLIPFTSSYEPLWTGLGSLAFYILLALIASSYLRNQIGPKVWRAFHYASYLAFLMALIHGVMTGSDSGAEAMKILYWLTGGVSLFLLYYRILSSRPARQRYPSRRMVATQVEELTH